MHNFPATALPIPSTSTFLEPLHTIPLTNRSHTEPSDAVGHIRTHVEDLVARAVLQRSPRQDGRHVVDVTEGAQLLTAPEDRPKTVLVDVTVASSMPTVAGSVVQDR